MAIWDLLFCFGGSMFTSVLGLEFWGLQLRARVGGLSFNLYEALCSCCMYHAPDYLQLSIIPPNFEVEL